uniref:SOSS complex subunit C n=1 Tax=Urocitellus parryii TaxID=9999 RepID=A0A8D2KNB0_UROPR
TQDSTYTNEISIALPRPALNKDFWDHAEQQHITAQQKTALQHAHASTLNSMLFPVSPSNQMSSRSINKAHIISALKSKCALKRIQK